MKQKGWEGVTGEVNAVGGYGRSVAEIKKKWVCRKSETKNKMASVKREQQKTGGVKTNQKKSATWTAEFWA